MLGLFTWLGAGAAALLIARLLPQGRPAALWLELIVAIIAAVVAGMAATAMDFGGWAEPDARAFAFALAIALAVLAMGRAVRLLNKQASTR